MKDYTKQIEKELRKDIYDLRRELRADISNVKKLREFDETIPTYAINTLKNLEKDLRNKSIRRQDIHELNKTHRQLKYIRGLKSSSVEGAKRVADIFEPISNNLKLMTKEQRDEWWEIYEHIYKQSSTYERFKYDIFEYADKVYDVNDSSFDSKDIGEKIIKFYENSQLLGEIIKSKNQDYEYTKELLIKMGINPKTFNPNREDGEGKLTGDEIFVRKLKGLL